MTCATQNQSSFNQSPVNRLSITHQPHGPATESSSNQPDYLPTTNLPNSTDGAQHAKTESSGMQAPEADARLTDTIILNLKPGPVSRNALRPRAPTPPPSRLRV
jgi:hypothetical protein